MKKTVKCLEENMASIIAKYGMKGFYVGRIDKSPEYGRKFVIIQFLKEEE